MPTRVMGVGSMELPSAYPSCGWAPWKRPVPTRVMGGPMEAPGAEPSAVDRPSCAGLQWDCSMGPGFIRQAPRTTQGVEVLAPSTRRVRFCAHVLATCGGASRRRAWPCTQTGETTAGALGGRRTTNGWNCRPLIATWRSRLIAVAAHP